MLRCRPRGGLEDLDFQPASCYFHAICGCGGRRSAKLQSDTYLPPIRSRPMSNYLILPTVAAWRCRLYAYSRSFDHRPCDLFLVTSTAQNSETRAPILIQTQRFNALSQLIFLAETRCSVCDSAERIGRCKVIRLCLSPFCRRLSLVSLFSWSALLPRSILDPSSFPILPLCFPVV